MEEVEGAERERIKSFHLLPRRERFSILIITPNNLRMFSITVPRTILRSTLPK